MNPPHVLAQRSRATIGERTFGASWLTRWVVSRLLRVGTPSDKRKLDPRFARYRRMVSAPELWDPAAVKGALHLLRARGDGGEGQTDRLAAGDAGESEE